MSDIIVWSDPQIRFCIRRRSQAGKGFLEGIEIKNHGTPNWEVIVLQDYDPVAPDYLWEQLDRVRAEDAAERAERASWPTTKRS